MLDLALGMPRKTFRDALGMPYGGYRKLTGEWVESGLSAAYWTSTPSGIYSLGAQFNDTGASIVEMPRGQGNSIKCIKDTSMTKTGSLSLTVNAGTNAANATLYACGKNVTLSATGSTTLNDLAPGTDCSNAAIYKPGYVCQWTTNVPTTVTSTATVSSVCTTQATTTGTTNTNTTTNPMQVLPDAKNYVLFKRVKVPYGSIK